eukprot:maker-scaffold662_size116868-snap-gene-0.14 protein:Tk03145 transcript:maker-scaffold662_size116868-snap-gene-0.14-mRNA-1 annotation:"a2 protein"
MCPLSCRLCWPSAAPLPAIRRSSAGHPPLLSRPSAAPLPAIRCSSAGHPTRLCRPSAVPLPAIRRASAGHPPRLCWPHGILVIQSGITKYGWAQCITLSWSAMKSLVLILTCLAVASAQDFSDCTREVEKIVGIFSSEEIITTLAEHLANNICIEDSPSFPDQNICRDAVIKRWPEVTEVFVNHKDIFAQEACKQAIPFQLDWNCETCRYRIGGLYDVMRSYAFYGSFINFARGPEYCEKEGLSADEQAACKLWLDRVLSRAFFVIRSIPTDDLCDRLYGLCKGMISCRTGMQNMYEQVGNDNTIARTKTLLKAEVCPQAWVESQQGCEKGVDAHWSAMAKEISNEQFNFGLLCGNYYDFFAESDANSKWDCSTCQNRVREVMRYQINHQIDLISGAINDILFNSDLCKGSLSQAESLTCEKYVRAFVPRALQTIHDDGFNHPDKLCRNVFNFGAECVMRFLSVLLTCLAVASAQDFSDCTREVEDIVGIFSSNEVITGLADHLANNICIEDSSTFPDQKICRDAVIKRWPEVTAVFVNHKDIFAEEACKQAIPIQLDWNCETCRHRIKGLYNVMRSYSFFQSFIKFAKGPEYCEKEGLSVAEQDTCKLWLDKFLSRAFFVIRTIPTEDICDELYGLCQGMIGCRDGMQKMYEHLGNDATIERTKSLLKAEVCPQAWVENQEGCNKGVDAHWPAMAKEIVNSGISFTLVCANYYDFFAEAEVGAVWDCSTCQMRVREVMRFQVNHQIDLISAAIDDIIYLNPLCKDVPTQEETLACEKYVRAFVPRAIQTIHDDGFNHPDKLCRNIFSFGAECKFEEATTTTTTTATTTTSTTTTGGPATGHGTQIVAGTAPKDLCREAVGREAVGREAVGREAVGREAVGREAVGREAVGRKAVGRKAVGREAVGREAVGREAVGREAVGREAVGREAVGREAVGREAVGREAVGREAVAIAIFPAPFTNQWADGHQDPTVLMDGLLAPLIMPFDPGIAIFKYLEGDTAPKDLCREAVGREAVGREAVGREAVGREAVGREAVGREAVCREAVGRKAVGREAVGREAVGREAVGREAVGREAVGREAVGREAVGREAVGREAVAIANFPAPFTNQWADGHQDPTVLMDGLLAPLIMPFDPGIAIFKYLEGDVMSCVSSSAAG